MTNNTEIPESQASTKSVIYSFYYGFMFITYLTNCSKIGALGINHKKSI